MTIIPIVINAFGTVTDGLIKGVGGLEIRGQVETIQTIALYRAARNMGRLAVTQLTLM